MSMTKRAADALVDAGYGKRPRLDDVSAEVASDFKDSLSDLSINDRYQISTLTIIAKENTEHARAISEALRTHIRDVPPNRKLPALYVLDSIVKNVGTPYTIFLSQDLFQTFFDAYTVVDDSTRKQMESMLKTWKEPIPGSLEQKPVFPIDATRRIETALIKARTAIIEKQKTSQNPLHQQMSRPSSNVHSLPPRPPVGNSPALNSLQHAQYPPPFYMQQQQQQQYSQQNGTPSSDFQYGMPSGQNGGYQNQVSAASLDGGYEYGFNSAKPPPPMYAQGMYQQPPPQIRSPAPFQQGYDQRATRSPQPGYVYPPPPLPYQAQQATSSQFPSWLPPPLSNGSAPPPPPASSLSFLQLPGSVPPQQQHLQPPQLPPPPQQFQFQPPPHQPPPLTDLAELLRLANGGGLGTQPQIPQGISGPSLVPPPSHTPLAQITNQNSTPSLAPAFLAGLSPQKPGPTNDVKLTAASLKIPRPHLLSTLFPPGSSSQCTTCGRRFHTSTSEGKTRKTHHLDAHFRTNMRLTANLESRAGTHVAQRSWYIDEAEWISYREFDDADPEPDNNADVGEKSKTDGSGTKVEKQESFVAAPTDLALRKLPCPICQEEFDTVWHDGAQEWVWLDAIKVPVEGGAEKIYHASCLGMMSKDAQ